MACTKLRRGNRVSQLEDQLEQGIVEQKTVGVGVMDDRRQTHLY